MKVLVCFSSSREWYGRVIRWFTRSRVNHVFLAYTSSEWGGWWAVQIDERGVVKIPIERVEYDSVECYDIGLPIGDAIQNSRGFYGGSYDWLGIFGFLLKLVAWRAFGSRIANPLHRSGELFCSEFVTKFLQLVNGMYEPILRLRPECVAPGGDPVDLGTPSLLYEFLNIPEIVRVDTPWEGR